MEEFKSQYLSEPIKEDIRYIAWIEYEYLSERYDRSLPGYLNEHDEWIPKPDFIKDSSFNARYRSSEISKKYDIPFSGV